MLSAALADRLKRLPLPPAPEAAGEYCGVAEACASRVSLILCARHDLDRLIGPGNREMMLGNHRNHARFVCALLTSYDAAVLVDTLEWVARSYVSHGFSADYWPVQIDAWLAVLREELSEPSFAAIEPLYAFMREAMAEIARPL